MTAETKADRFLAHVIQLGGGIEPDMYVIDSTHVGQLPITAMVYGDLPEPGLMTGITYGLSLSEHPDWRMGKPELIITVRSADIAWALVIASFAEELRGECPFTYGGILNHDQRISPESAMTAFVVFAPAALDPKDAEIDMGDYKIYLNGCYPIHESERHFIQEHGLEAFWKLDWDINDVRRPPVAWIVAFLCSPKAVAINGDAVVVGGGIRGAIHYWLQAFYLGTAICRGGAAAA